MLITILRHREIRYSHSIINEPAKLLICMASEHGTKVSTVILTVNLSRTSIGAHFRAIRRKLTFRDLSISIDSRDHRRHYWRASVSVRVTPKKGWHQTPYAIVPTYFFATPFTVTMPHKRCSSESPTRPIDSHSSRRTIWRSLSVRRRKEKPVAAALPRRTAVPLSRNRRAHDLKPPPGSETRSPSRPV
jgi:hypothetical protein